MERLTPDFGFGFGGEGRAKIAFARGAGDGDDHFPFVLRAFGHLDRGPDVGARGDAHQDSFFLCETSRHGESIVVGNLNALSDLGVTLRVFQMEVRGNETGAGALDFVRTGFYWKSSEGL